MQQMYAPKNRTGLQSINQNLTKKKKKGWEGSGGGTVTLFSPTQARTPAGVQNMLQEARGVPRCSRLA